MPEATVAQLWLAAEVDEEVRPDPWCRACTFRSLVMIAVLMVLPCALLPPASSLSLHLSAFSDQDSLQVPGNGGGRRC